MTGWVLPVVAGAFWIGILVWPGLGSAVPWWVLLGLGFGALGGAAVSAAPSEPRALSVLERVTGRGEEPMVAALGGSARGVARAPPAASAISVAAAFVLLGAGWAGLHEKRAGSSALAGLAPQ